MKRALIIALALVATGIGGYLAGSGKDAGGRNATPAADFAHQGSDAMPDAAESPRFYARLAQTKSNREAGVDELWRRLVAGEGLARDRQRAVEQLLSLDPVAAILLAKGSGEDQLLRQLLQRWAEIDPVAAFRSLDQLPEYGTLTSIDRRKITENALNRAIAANDETLIFEILGESYSFNQRSLATLSAVEIGGLLDLLSKNNFRHQIADVALATLAEKDYAAAEKWLEENPVEGFRRDGMTRLLLTAELGVNFASAASKALAYVDSHPRDTNFRKAIGFAAARENPGEAVVFLQELIDRIPEIERLNYAANFVNMAPAEQREAMRLELDRLGLLKVPDIETPRFRWPPKTEQEFRDLVTSEDGSSNMEHGRLPIPLSQAAQIIAEADPAEVSPNVVQGIARRLSGQDPQAALEWAAGLEGTLGLDAARVAIDHWVSLDADAAMAYAVRLPDSQFQSAAAGAIVKKRVALDRGATREWIEGLEANSFRDSASEYFVNSSKKPSVDLLPLVISIGDEPLRRRALLHLLDGAPDAGLLVSPDVSPADRAFLEAAKLGR